MSARRTPSGKSMFDVEYANSPEFREYYHALKAHWAATNYECECTEYCS